MGAGGFHGRVRDGIGCGLPAMATRSSNPSFACRCATALDGWDRFWCVSMFCAVCVAMLQRAFCLVIDPLDRVIIDTFGLVMTDVHAV